MSGIYFIDVGNHCIHLLLLFFFFFENTRSFKNFIFDVSKGNSLPISFYY